MIIKNYLLFFIVLIVSFVTSVKGFDSNRITHYKNPSRINDTKNDQGSLLAIKVAFDACLSNRFILRGFHLVKKGQKTPRMNLGISQVFNQGRILDDNFFDKPYTFTDMLYSKKTDELREGSIKVLLQARDFSFGLAGYRFGELLKKQASMFPALKLLGVGIGLEYTLEEGYVNHLLPTDQRLLENQRIKEAKGSNIINNIVSNKRAKMPHQGVENISFDHFSKTKNKDIKELKTR